MADFEDFTPEEVNELDKDLLRNLRSVYQSGPADARSLARIRERLLQQDLHQQQTNILRMQRERSDTMNSGTLKGRTWQRPISMIAAVLIMAILVGSFIAVFNHLHSTSGNGNTTPHATSPTVPATIPTTAPTAVPTVALKNAGSISFIHMADATTGWALTDKVVLRTTDGGAHWRDVTPPHASITGATLAVLDASTVWVAAAQLGGSTIQVFHTVNAGQTWREAVVKVNGFADGAQITFIDANHGWMLAGLGAGAGSEAVAVYRTTDGGSTWTNVSSTNPPGNITPGALPLGGDKNGLSFITPSNGWAAGTEPSNIPWFYVTHDGGQTWHWQTLPLPPNQASAQFSITRPTFFNTSDGVLPVNGLSVGSQAVGGSVIYVTHDGGATWNSTSLLPGNASSADFIDANHGWVTDGSFIYMTSDGGQHWTKIFTVTNNAPKFQQLDFVSSEIGLAVAYTDSGAMLLLRTVDGGRTWTQVGYIVYRVR